MSRGFPSMTALLGLLAVAGYQNRDKLAEMLGGLGAGGRPGSVPNAGAMHGGGDGMGTGTGAGMGGGLDSILSKLTGAIGGGGVGSLLGGGLSELVDRFKQAGQADAVDSWVGTGPNRDVPPSDLEQAIGPDVMATLAQQTGLSRDELLARLSRELPSAVDKYTPDGRIPDQGVGI